MARVALDADVLIAFLDPGDPQHERAVEELRPRLAAGERLLVGASVYAEVMVRPLERGSEAQVDAHGAQLLTFDRRLRRIAARVTRGGPTSEGQSS